MKTYHRPECAVFKGPNSGALRKLSPDARLHLRINGQVIQSTQALFDACRFPHKPELQRKLVSGGAADLVEKHEGESRSDWNEVRLEVMQWCLRVRLAFNYPELSALLRSTAGKEIVWQPGTWDRFWGATPVGRERDLLKGHNHLGRLLMKLRAEIEAGSEEDFLLVQPLAVKDFLLFGQPVAQVPKRPVRRSPRKEPEPKDLPWDGPWNLEAAAEAILGQQPVDRTSRRFGSLLEMTIEFLRGYAWKLHQKYSKMPHRDPAWKIDDLVMETIVRFVEESEFAGNSAPPLRDWTCTTERNLFFDARKPRTKKTEVHEPGPDAGELLDTLRDQYAAHLAMDRLRAKKPRYARALELAEIEELSSKEAGEEMGLNANAFDALKKRAREKYRNYFKAARAKL